MIKIIVKTFQLILPVLIPSWRFFDSIAPSPRVEFALFDGASASDADTDADGDIAQDWQEFWPRPEHVGVRRMLRRMLWNPCWNDSLYVVACAERLIKLEDEETQKHSSEQIAQRIRRHLPEDKKADSFKFRLIFMNREGADVQRHLLYMSQLYEGESQ